MVPGLFVRKTFRSQERTVPMGNFHSLDVSFRGTLVPNFQGLICSQELSFLQLFYKTLANKNKAQTAVTAVRFCFVVGLVLFVFQK